MNAFILAFFALELSTVLCFVLFPSRELWRREAAVDQTIQNARDELTKCERNLRATMGKVCAILHVITCPFSSPSGLVAFSFVCPFYHLLLSPQSHWPWTFTATLPTSTRTYAV